MLSYIPEEPPQQDEGIIRQWVGTHNLKKVNGEWWKGTCKVVTGGESERCKIIRAYHDVPAYGHPGISRTKELVAKCYVRVEHAARLELEGYDQVALPVVNEACASGTQ